LALATDSNMHDEDLYSVRLIKPVKTSIGLKNDAEHIPKRMAESLFTNQELNKYLSFFDWLRATKSFEFESSI